MTVILYVDGGTRGSVICLVDPLAKRTIVKHRKGNLTNNELEYLAIIYALEYVHSYYPHKPIIIKSDSMLAVKQINHKWRVTNDNLRTLNKRVEGKRERMVKISWTPRENNLAGIHLESLKDK